MTSPAIGKLDYRQALGDRALLNNVPFLATVDAETAQALLSFDPWNAQSIYKLFGQLHTDRVEALREAHPILPGFADILMTQDVHRHPLLDDACCGYQGVYCRTAFAERCVNEVKLASLRQSLVQFDYDVLEKIALRRRAGGAPWRPPEVCYSECQKMLVFDQYGLFQPVLQQSGTENVYELFKAEASKPQPVQLSDQTLRVYEDFLHGLALAVQRDCLQKRENYAEQDFFELADYCCSQGQVLTIQRQCVDEARRMALQAQIRGTLLQVRTLLAQTDQNYSPFILEGKTDGQQFGIFLSSQEGAQLASLTTLPHPVSLMLDQYSDLQLEVILTYLECVEAIVRFALLKTRLQGQEAAEAGKRVQELLEFAFEIGKIHAEEGNTRQLVVPSTAYLEPADIVFLER